MILIPLVLDVKHKIVRIAMVMKPMDIVMFVSKVILLIINYFFIQKTKTKKLSKQTKKTKKLKLIINI